MFFWFLEEGGELSIVHDLAKAARYVELLNMHLLDFSPPYTRFEVIEVTEFGQQALPASPLLGFDLSAGYNNSLLSQGLEPRAGIKTLPEPIQQLISLLGRFYAPHLNQHGLFQTPEIASDCLQSMDALQRLCPNLFEGVELGTNFRPVGVYLPSVA